MEEINFLSLCTSENLHFGLILCKILKFMSSLYFSANFSILKILCFCWVVGWNSYYHYFVEITFQILYSFCYLKLCKKMSKYGLFFYSLFQSQACLSLLPVNSPLFKNFSTSDKVDFKPTLIKWDKEGHYILIKGEIDQKEIIIINLYAPNVNAPNFIKHTLKDLKAYINATQWLWETLTPHYHQ
jgi:hypothetical protein